jgi:hypothetical protein
MRQRSERPILIGTLTEISKPQECSDAPPLERMFTFNFASSAVAQIASQMTAARRVGVIILVLKAPGRHFTVRGRSIPGRKRSERAGWRPRATEDA